MSDTMLLGVLRMPIDDLPPLSPLAQLVDRAREAADRIESDAAEIKRLRAEVEALRADAQRWMSLQKWDGQPHAATDSVWIEPGR